MQVVQYAAVCLMKSKPAGSSGNTDLPEQSAWRLKYAILSSLILEFEQHLNGTRKYKKVCGFRWFSMIFLHGDVLWISSHKLRKRTEWLNDSMTIFRKRFTMPSCTLVWSIQHSQGLLINATRVQGQQPPDLMRLSRRELLPLIFTGGSLAFRFQHFGGASNQKGLWHVRRFCESRESYVTIPKYT